MRTLATCATFLLILIASVQAQKDGAKDKALPKDKDKLTPKEKPAKPEEPKNVVALRTLGAIIESDGPDIVGVNLFGVKLSDGDLANLAGLKSLRTLDLSGTPIGDSGL